MSNESWVIIKSSIADAYIQVTTFVAGTLLFFYTLEKHFKIDLKKSLLINWEAPLCTYLEMNRTKAVSMPNLEMILKISTINKAVTYWPNTKAPNLLVMKIARIYPTSKPTIFKIKVLDAPLISSIKWTSPEYFDRYDFILFKNSNSLNRIVFLVK